MGLSTLAGFRFASHYGQRFKALDWGSYVPRMVQFVIFSVWICFLTFLGSWLFELSFAVSFAFVTVLIFFGHLITLDEDLKGGWCNPSGDTKIRNSSLIELTGKLVFSIVVWCVVIAFPELSVYRI